MFSLVGRLKGLPITNNLAVYFLAEVGVVNADMKFQATAVEEQKSTLSYVGDIASEIAFDMGDLSLAAKMGLSKSGLKDKYSFGSGSYSNPYGKALAFVEVGLYFVF